MKYTIEVLSKLRRDHLGAASALELQMAEMLDPNTEAAIDRIRQHRLHAEELHRAILVLQSSNVVNIEDAR